MTATIDDPLVRQHHRQQLAVRARLVAALLQDWRLLDFKDIDGSAERWLNAAVATVLAHRTLSAMVAAGYIRSEFARQGAGGEPVIVTGPLMPTVALMRSLMVTGPIAVKHFVSLGRPETDAMDRAFGKTAASATRHALDGGRQAVISSALADPVSMGWERVNSAPECNFCSSLVGEVTRNEIFPSHDHCTCSSVPVYRAGKGNN